MPQVTIEYKKPETLKMLKGLGKYFDFKVFTDKSKKEPVSALTITPGDESVDTSEIGALFSSKDFNAKELRKKAWQRTQ